MAYLIKKGKALLEEIESADEKLSFWFLGQTGAAFRFRGRTYLIDPMLVDLFEYGQYWRTYEVPFSPDEIQADYVLCTHSHIDHMSCETIRGLIKANPDIRFVFPTGCEKYVRTFLDQLFSSGIIKADGDNLVPVKPGQQLKLGDIYVTAFSTAHPRHIYDEEDESMSLGYSLLFDDYRVTHLGDTFLTDELYGTLREFHTDAFFPPVNGDDFFRRRRGIIGNMEAEEEALLADDIGAGISFPMHFDLIRGNTCDPERFVNRLYQINPERKCRIPVPGQKVVLVQTDEADTEGK